MSAYISYFSFHKKIDAQSRESEECWKFYTLIEVVFSPCYTSLYLVFPHFSHRKIWTELIFIDPLRFLGVGLAFIRLQFPMENVYTDLENSQRDAWIEKISSVVAAFRVSLESRGPWIE